MRKTPRTSLDLKDESYDLTQVKVAPVNGRSIRKKFISKLRELLYCPRNHPPTLSFGNLKVLKSPPCTHEIFHCAKIVAISSQKATLDPSQTGPLTPPYPHSFPFPIFLNVAATISQSSFRPKVTIYPLHFPEPVTGHISPTFPSHTSYDTTENCFHFCLLKPKSDPTL